ncbi:hypothetical protein BD289DRAFT_432520 [Coniella lustricola]|uniref:Uncharacterized protein n=1 Tax=Coniella lustricola TaxID=2025994 RepID=A0A2T3A9R7_9PEZI|nr:hypothetical protein BD289DRAFT_432520 [Coniella lustricola]
MLCIKAQSTSFESVQHSVARFEWFLIVVSFLSVTTPSESMTVGHFMSSKAPANLAQRPKNVASTAPAVSIPLAPNGQDTTSATQKECRRRFPWLPRVDKTRYSKQQRLLFVSTRFDTCNRYQICLE